MSRIAALMLTTVEQGASTGSYEMGGSTSAGRSSGKNAYSSGEV